MLLGFCGLTFMLSDASLLVRKQEHTSPGSGRYTIFVAKLFAAKVSFIWLLF
jgi:hypothetical protein